MAADERDDEVLFQVEGDVEEDGGESEAPEGPSVEDELVKQINEIFGTVSGEDEDQAPTQAQASPPSPEAYDQMSKGEQKQLQRQTGLNEEQLKEWINENALNDPYAAQKAYYQRAVAPEIAGALSQVWDTVIDLSKDRLQNDPQLSTVWKKYKKEIEAEVNSLSPQQRYADPKNVYKNAALAVKGRHSDELQAEFAKQKVDELLPYLKERLGLAEKENGKESAPIYAETNGTAPSGAKKKRQKAVPVKRAVYEQMKKEALAKGMDPQRYMAIQRERNPGRFE